jgi:hypothetical protein
LHLTLARCLGRLLFGEWQRSWSTAPAQVKPALGTRRLNDLFSFIMLSASQKSAYCVHLVKKLYRINHPNIEDMMNLKMMQNEIGIIHEEYVHHLSTLDLDDLKELREVEDVSEARRATTRRCMMHPSIST